MPISIVKSATKNNSVPPTAIGKNNKSFLVLFLVQQLLIRIFLVELPGTAPGSSLPLNLLLRLPYIYNMIL